MQLESTSKIGLNDYVKFFRFFNFKTGWKKYLIPAATVILLLMAVEIFITVTYSDNASIIFLEIFMGILLVFLLFYLWYIMPLVSYKLSSKLYSIENCYTWYNDHFIVKTDTDGITSTSNIKYTSLLKTVEAEGYLYLYMTKNQAHIIPKNSFTTGTWTELSSALKTTLAERYLTCVR